MNINNQNNTQDLVEDFAIISQILEGDSNLYSKLVSKYSRVVTALIRKMIRDEDDIDDLTQETFIKAYKALSSFKEGFSFSSWIYRIASNTCIDFIRRKRFNFISIDQPITKQGDEEQYLDIEDEDNTPELAYMLNERKKAVEDAIDGLPDNYKVIIKMRHEDEMEYSEISKMLNMPLGTVKAHLFRARKILLSTLKQNKSLFSDF
jgi:RNA polymerase sigma-70 factor (ECF subfamily)